MPTRNANSAAADRDVNPASIAAKIAAAERDVPGKTPATTWLRPTHTTTSHVTCSFGVAFASVKWLLIYIRTHRFTAFAWYRIVFGAVLLAVVG